MRRKREEYAGYVDQYFNNKEEDIHKDTFRYNFFSILGGLYSSYIRVFGIAGCG